MNKPTRIVGLLPVLLLSTAAQSGIVVYEEGDKKVEVGGRIQALYESTDEDGQSTEDSLYFRRLRPYISASLAENWKAKIEVDFGESVDGDELKVKDAYAVWSGLADGRFQITIGNAKHGFAREFQLSSAKQQLVERGFVGDHNYGTPDRVLGVKLDGGAYEGKFGFTVGIGAENHDPNVDRIDLDSPVTDEGDWNQGRTISGRVDFHPLGEMKFDQVDFKRGPSRFTVSLGAFYWENDDDRNTYTDPDGVTTSLTKVDLDEATGVELSGGYRGHGWSIDAEFQKIQADTVDPLFTGGVYRDGTTDLDKMGFNAGYMVLKDRVELAAGWDSQDADNYQTSWDRLTLGANFYVKQHNLKFQVNYRQAKNLSGLQNQDSDELFVNSQFVF